MEEIDYEKAAADFEKALKNDDRYIDPSSKSTLGIGEPLRFDKQIFPETNDFDKRFN